MKRLDYIVRLAKEVVDVYEFNTFLIGAVLPPDIYEREDQIRARLKIRGKENIKNQLLNELRRKFEILTYKKIDYRLPDVSITVAIEGTQVNVTAKARTLTLAGRYIKKQRGIPQKHSRCPHCKDKGCGCYDNNGQSRSVSIENIIAHQVLSFTKCKALRFSWLGSEDRNSLVSGSGRPFFVSLLDPKVRTIKSSLNIDTPEIFAAIDSEPKCIPHSPIRFLTKTKIIIDCLGTITENNLQRLHLLNDAPIKLQNKKKVITKRIYTVEAKMINPNRFMLTMLADGGIAIKDFVSGREYTSPNVSDILGLKCESVLFDILHVDLL